MKVALCLYGQPRTYRFCAPSLYRHLISRYNPEIFICSDSDEAGLREVYDPTSIEVISSDELLGRIGNRIHWYGETVPNPGPYKEYPIIPANDLMLTYKMWRCREMMREYEVKHGEFDIVIGTRFDAKFLSIQPIKKLKENTFYIPKVDAFGKSADKDGTHWGMGYCNHIWWATSKVAYQMLNSFSWTDDCYKDTHLWCGESMTKYFCDKMKIEVQYTDVTFMLIRGTSEAPLEGLPPWSPLSDKVHPEYLAQDWEKEKVVRKIEPPRHDGFFW